MDLQTLLQQVYFGNTIEDYTWFFGMLLLGLVFKKLISRYFSHLLYRLVGKFKCKLNNLMHYSMRQLILCNANHYFHRSSHIELPSTWELASKMSLSKDGLGKVFLCLPFLCMDFLEIGRILWFFCKIKQTKQIAK